MVARSQGLAFFLCTAPQLMWFPALSPIWSKQSVVLMAVLIKNLRPDLPRRGLSDLILLKFSADQ